MDSIRQYILGIVAASVLCSIIIRLVNAKTANATLIKTICSIALTICIISPLVGFDLLDTVKYDINDYLDGETYATDSFSTTQKQIQTVIKERTQAYVLEKAKSYDCDLHIDITISKEAPYKPISAHASGQISPAVKQKLQQIMEADLGIPRERQLWN